MSTGSNNQYMTLEEYLASERASETKHEFLSGEVFAMSGASRAHGLIRFNLARRIGEQLDRKPCEMFAGDMRVRVNPTWIFTFPTPESDERSVRSNPCVSA